MEKLKNVNDMLAYIDYLTFVEQLLNIVRGMYYLLEMSMEFAFAWRNE